ncbi:MAG: nucleotidyl transferase AbiEii/AbiGii toxin family protein, partial [Candidatus Diapherotrites archaeon]|nr:nucleotidyl transferase AbiEii/AbiGii toxin family protein [Candidatus Diapherotrites archaeon]
MIIPLEKRLRKRQQVEVGQLQDELVDVVYELDNSAVLHGGTAIWRCYSGNRFSEDLDFYAPVQKGFQERFLQKTRLRGLRVLKFKKTQNLVFTKISNENAEVRVELNFSSRKKGAVRAYERVNGTIADVLALTPEELVLEKINAYKSRRFVRDIYDVFHLSRLVESNNA